MSEKIAPRKYRTREEWDAVMKANVDLNIDRYGGAK